MADFTIVAPVPFTVEGTDGTIYELPRVKDMGAEQIGEMGKIGEADGEVDKVRATRAFIQSLCPDIASEPLTDMGYLNLFKALAEGSGISVGES